MEQPREQAFRRSGVLLLVLGLHALLLELILGMRHSHSGQREPVETEVLLLNPQQHAVPPAARHGAARHEQARAAPSPNSGAISDRTAVTLPGESGSAPRTDWQREAEIVIESLMPEIEREDRRRCAEAERTHAARPFGCRKRYYDKPWQASGNLLRDLRDPERPRGGTPDPLPDAFLKAPLSVVLKDQNP